jgi:hypothetical protein
MMTIIVAAAAASMMQGSSPPPAGDLVTDSNREVWTTSIGDQCQALDNEDAPK